MTKCYQGASMRKNKEANKLVLKLLSEAVHKKEKEKKFVKETLKVGMENVFLESSSAAFSPDVL